MSNINPLHERLWKYINVYSNNCHELLYVFQIYPSWKKSPCITCFLFQGPIVRWSRWALSFWFQLDLSAWLGSGSRPEPFNLDVDGERKASKFEPSCCPNPKRPNFPVVFGKPLWNSSEDSKFLVLWGIDKFWIEITWNDMTQLCSWMTRWADNMTQSNEVDSTSLHI